MNWRIVVTSSSLALAALLASCGTGSATTGTLATTTESTLADTAPPEPSQPPATVPEQTEPVLVVVESGGCYQAGPLCRTLTFFADGTATVDWPEEADQAQQSYDLDPEVIGRWIDVVVSTDLDALVDSLPEGSCQGCVDGVDYTMTIDVAGTTATLDSMVVEFVRDEPLFTEAFAAVGVVPWEPPASATEGY